MEARKLNPALKAVPAEIDLSIVVVTWNSAKWIGRCLRALPAACEDLRYQVTVYDNASQDETLRLVEGENVQVVSSKTNDGFAAATNRAIAATRGRYVLLLNPDCELAPRALTILFEFLENHPDTAAAVPLLSDSVGHSQREFQLRRIPTYWTLISEIFALDKVFPKNRWTSRYRYRDLDLSAPVAVDQPAAAAMLLRRTVVDAIGEFDERFGPAWFEDVDYCKRLASAGYEIFVVPTAHGLHFGGSSLEHLGLAAFLDLWYRNMWRYARKWYSPGRAEALRWAIIAGMLLRFPVAIAGIAHPEVGRWTAVRAYGRVVKKAFDRWDESPASSW